AEAVTELAEEREVEVYLPVRRAIEGSDRRARLAARRIDRAAEEDQPRGVVGPAALLEELPPGVLDVSEHGTDEVRLGIVRRRLSLRPAIDGRRRAFLQPTEEIERIRAGEDAQHQNQEQPATPQLQPGPANGRSATILDVVAAAHVTPAHRDLPG